VQTHFHKPLTILLGRSLESDLHALRRHYVTEPNSQAWLAWVTCKWLCRALQDCRPGNHDPGENSCGSNVYSKPTLTMMRPSLGRSAVTKLVILPLRPELVPGGGGGVRTDYVARTVVFGLTCAITSRIAHACARRLSTTDTDSARITQRFTTGCLVPRVCIRATDELGECACRYVTFNPPSASRPRSPGVDKIVIGIALKAGAATETKKESVEIAAAAGRHQTTTRSGFQLARTYTSRRDTQQFQPTEFARLLREERALLDVPRSPPALRSTKRSRISGTGIGAVLGRPRELAPVRCVGIRRSIARSRRQSSALADRTTVLFVSIK
jgi:hypothetical protein